MDKKSWPWRRKSSDKSLTLTEPGNSSPPPFSRQAEDQVVSGLLADHMQVPDVRMLQQQQQFEEKIKNLNERLLAADDLVKQHVKVAEEAVSGWEKSKAESVALKHQLDAVVEQKHATEDRVSHLDGALKECMRQLRHVREEQEQKIHEATVKKTRDWDKLRSELEARLADADQKLLEAVQENGILYKTVQEQDGTIAELRQARSQAQAEVEVLQVRIETFEKENSSLKYEVYVLNKELEIRNQEKEITKRAAEITTKQQQESVKKISKLESECQRLRILVRRKLPGPGALAQMKLEVETLVDKEKIESPRWRSGNKVPVSPRPVHLESIKKLDNELLSERLLTMEEETKMLKEALTKRNSELQGARLMCARTAGKLSIVEGQLDAVSRSPRLPKTHVAGCDIHSEASFSLIASKELSQASLSEDGNDDEHSCADSWASALVTELAQFRKEKNIQNPNMSIESSKLDLLDDFLEIERMASLSPGVQEGKIQTGEIAKSMRAEAALPSENCLPHQILAKREAELQAANQFCQEISKKLAAAEEQLNALRSKNAANDLNLFSLQQRLNMIFEAHEGGEDSKKTLEEVKSAIAAAHCSSVDGLQVHVRKLSKVSSHGHDSGTGSPEGPHTSSSSLSTPVEGASPSTCEIGNKGLAMGPELTSAICKVVRLVEDLALALSTHHLIVCSEHSSHNSGIVHANSDSQSNPCSCIPKKPVESNTCIGNFIAVSNKFLHGSVELVHFMVELSSILSHMIKIGSSGAHNSANKGAKSSWSRPISESSEREEFDEADSPISNLSKSDGSQKVITMVAPADERILEVKNPRIQEIEEDLRKVRAEKAALESHMRAEFARMAGVEERFAQLKQEKVGLELVLEEEKEKIEVLKGQLHDAEQLVANLRVRLASSELSKTMADERLSSVVAARAKLESQIKEKESELKQVHEKLESLEKIISDEQIRNGDLHAKCEDLEQQLQKAGLNCSQSPSMDGPKAGKDLGIANATEKLAECQRTILILGQQLKELASPKEPFAVNPVDDQSVVECTQSESHFHQNKEQPSGKKAKDEIKNRHILNHERNLLAIEKTNSEDQRSKQRIPSDPGDSIMSNAIDHELMVVAKGGHGSGRTISDFFGNKSPAHEDYIQVVAQMPSSPDTETDKQLVTYVPKRASKKKSSRPFAGIDLSKSLNLGPSSSPQKHGNSFSRFFSRNKNS